MGRSFFAAHTDTVFPLGTDLTIRENGGRLHGPGIGDNSLAVAALLMLPRVLDEAGVRTRARSAALREYQQGGPRAICAGSSRSWPTIGPRTRAR